MFQVTGLAGVVHARKAIELAAAGAEVHPDGQHVSPTELAIQLEGVPRSGRALQAVEQQDQRPLVSVRLGTLEGPVEIHEVAVRQLDPLGVERHVVATP